MESEADLESRPVLASTPAPAPPRQPAIRGVAIAPLTDAPTAGAAELLRRVEPPPFARITVRPGEASAGMGGAGGAGNAAQTGTGARGAASDGATPDAAIENPMEPTLWRPRVNGCTVVPDALPLVFEFYGPCKRHDLDYQTCGVPRATADAAFRENLHESCADSPLPALCHAAAETYFVGVRLLGPVPYVEGQSDACAHAPSETWDEHAEYP